MFGCFFCFLDPAPLRNEGSGTYAVVRSLFQTQDTPAQFEELDGGNWQMLSSDAAASALQNGDMDAAFFVLPPANPVELQLTGEADYYHRQGVPFLQRYLPFWIASIVDRYVVLLIPFIAIMVPLLRSMGPIYSWRMRARVFRWYGQLRDVDRLIHKGKIRDTLEEEIDRLHRLQDELTQVDVPLSYGHELYSLHLHVRYMINRLEAMRAGNPTLQGDALAD